MPLTAKQMRAARIANEAKIAARAAKRRAEKAEQQRRAAAVHGATQAVIKHQKIEEQVKHRKECNAIEKAAAAAAKRYLNGPR